MYIYMELYIYIYIYIYKNRYIKLNLLVHIDLRNSNIVLNNKY